MKSVIRIAVTTTLLAFSATSFAQTAVKPSTNATTQPSVVVTPAEKAKIEQVVRDYLNHSPEVIIQALQSFQQKQNEQAEQVIKETQSHAGSQANALFQQTTDPVVGNPNGTVTIAEFFDYQCSHCVKMGPVVEEVLKSNPNIRVVYKEFPIRGPISDFAARVSLAANMQGKYKEFNRALLIKSDELMSANKPLTQEIIFETAKNSGLDVDKLKKDMNDKTIDSKLKDTMQLAQTLKLFGTPAFFIGKTNAKGTDEVFYVPGRVEKNQMQEMIDKASK